MLRRPSRLSRIDAFLPDATLFRSAGQVERGDVFAQPRIDHQLDRHAVPGDRGQVAERREAGAALLRNIELGIACVLDRLRRAGVELPRCGGSEEHTSELQSLMRLSSAVFCLKQKK